MAPARFPSTSSFLVAACSRLSAESVFWAGRIRAALSAAAANSIQRCLLIAKFSMTQHRHGLSETRHTVRQNPVTISSIETIPLAAHVHEIARRCGFGLELPPQCHDID